MKGAVLQANHTMATKQLDVKSLELEYKYSKSQDSLNKKLLTRAQPDTFKH